MTDDTDDALLIPDELALEKRKTLSPLLVLHRPNDAIFATCTPSQDMYQQQLRNRMFLAAHTQPRP
jgi:hypothetical protein